MRQFRHQPRRSVSDVADRRRREHDDPSQAMLRHCVSLTDQLLDKEGR
jgi:hypothetical protein